MPVCKLKQAKLTQYSQRSLVVCLFLKGTSGFSFGSFGAKTTPSTTFGFGTPATTTTASSGFGSKSTAQTQIPPCGDYPVRGALSSRNRHQYEHRMGFFPNPSPQSITEPTGFPQSRAQRFWVVLFVLNWAFLHLSMHFEHIYQLVSFLKL